MTKLAVDDFPASEKIEIPPVLLTQVMGCLPFSVPTSPGAVLFYAVLSTEFPDVQCCAHAVPLVTIPTSPMCSAMLFYDVQCCVTLSQDSAALVGSLTSPLPTWRDTQYI